MALSLSTPAILAAALGIACAVTGAHIEGGAARGRLFVPLSGTLLIGIAVFGIAPELVRGAGWIATVGLAAAAYFALSRLDVHGHAVCPSCSHGESFAASLTIATALHAFFDGWGLSVVRSSTRGAVPSAIFAAILLHKVPEGLALGAMLRASTSILATAVALAAAAELMTVAGGVLGVWVAPESWVKYPLALALGMFIFLGVHALRDWKQNQSNRGERYHSH